MGLHFILLRLLTCALQHLRLVVARLTILTSTPLNSYAEVSGLRPFPDSLRFLPLFLLGQRSLLLLF
jgi:hypothetical protein